MEPSRKLPLLELEKIFQNLAAIDGYPSQYERYIREFVFQGIFAVLCDWLGSESPEPISEIAGVLNILKGKLARS